MPMPSPRKANRPGRSAVIFDRDGVLNVDHGYVGDPERMEWVEGARRAVRRLNESGVLVIVATNQSGVARGLFDLAAVDAVHAVMQADLTVDGARIDAFYVCPFLPDAKVADFAHADHPDRKPNPGMILRAMDEWGVDPGPLPRRRRQGIRCRGGPSRRRRRGAVRGRQPGRIPPAPDPPRNKA